VVWRSGVVFLSSRWFENLVEMSQEFGQFDDCIRRDSECDPNSSMAKWRTEQWNLEVTHVRFQAGSGLVEIIC